MNHRNVRRLLIDYHEGSLEQSRAETIRRHLTGCNQCSRELLRIKQVMDQLDRSESDPASSLDEVYWKSFYSAVMKRVASQPSMPRRLINFLDFLRPLKERPAYRLGFSFAVPVVLLLTVLWMDADNGRKEDPFREVQAETPSTQTSDPYRNYLRRSRTLLVALNNVEAKPGGQVDLTLERELSRGLASEAPTIKSMEIDPRSSRLVTDLGSLFQKVSNTGMGGRKSEIDRIRQDIQTQNLLFKVRMAESARSGVRSAFEGPEEER